MDLPQRIAYFSMEIGLQSAVPTYSGGLGILAGDTLRAAADLEVPIVGVTLVYRKGYFYQRIDDAGTQKEEPVEWPLDDFLEEMAPRVVVQIGGRPVHIRCWRYAVQGITAIPCPFICWIRICRRTPIDRSRGSDSAMPTCVCTSMISPSSCLRVTRVYWGTVESSLRDK